MSQKVVVTALILVSGGATGARDGKMSVVCACIVAMAGPRMDRWQRAFLEAAARPHAAVLAVGGPGTGKSTALVESVAAAVASGAGLDRLVVLTWSRPAAHRLRAEIIARIGRTQRAPVMTTVPGWCLALQSAYGPYDDPGAVPRVLTGPEQEMQVRELLTGAGEELWPPEVRPALRTRAFTQEVRTGMARARQHGLDPDDLIEMGERTGRPQWIGLGCFFERYLDVLDSQGVWDYAELVHRTRLLLLDERVAATISARVQGVHVDEFAELDRSQIGLLAQVHGLGVPVVATADPGTRVFAFRGADARAVADFPRRFTVPGLEEPQIIGFVSNHRSAPDVLAAVSGVLAHNPTEPGSEPMGASDPGRVTPSAVSVTGPDHLRGSAADEQPGVSALLCPTWAAQLDAVARWLRDHHMQGTAWSDMAVVGRTGRSQLALVARALAGLGVPVDVDGDDIALGEQRCVQHLVAAAESCLELASGGRFDHSRVLSLVGGPLCLVEPRDLRRLRRRLWRDGGGTGADELLLGLIHRSAATAMDPGRGRRGARGARDGRPVGVPDEDAARGDAPVAVQNDAAVAALEALGAVLGGSARRLRQGSGVYEVLWDLWQGTDWPARLREEALGDSEGSASAQRELDALCALFDLAARHDSLEGGKALRALVTEINGQEIPGDRSRESDPRGRGVQVITAHRTRGRQWSRVALIDLVEGDWPGRRGGAGLLLAEAIGDPADTTGQDSDGLEAAVEWVRQERRLVALAASRAADSLLVTAVAGEGSEGAAPSRFIAELGVEPRRDEHRGARRNNTLDELVGELRRTALDPGRSPALRRAAAERIAGLAGASSPRGRPLVRSANASTWWGLGGLSGSAPSQSRPELVVSVTGLEKLSQCPRRWFLDARAGAPDPAGPQAAIGSLVHKMAENAVTLGWSTARQHERIEECWAFVGFESPWQSRAQLRSTHEMIDRLGAWSAAPRGREVIGAEVPIMHRFHLPGGSVILRGTIDRLEREPDTGRVHVVDFKTGRRVPTRKQVAAHLQLGAYQLVVAEGACTDLTGPRPAVGGAELVQLRVPQGAREPGQPKVLAQPAIADHPYPPQDEPPPGGGPTWIHDAMAEALTHAASGDWSAVQGELCRTCTHRSGCPVWTREDSR
ncbi:DNA helicase II [Propionibacterium australiense]|nr:Exonuclease, phage-type/RecB, C-terminal [Propionibacterium australiense]VEH90209.1 DNA helicase II [Propionibacterium australiense]